MKAHVHSSRGFQRGLITQRRMHSEATVETEREQQLDLILELLGL